MKLLFAGLAAFLLSACYSHCPPGHMKNGKCYSKKVHKKRHGHKNKKHNKHYR